jgi:hypothetical protein
VHLLAEFFDWLGAHAALTTVMLVASVVVFIGSLWIAHYFLVTIPADYFASSHNRFEPWHDSRPLLRWTVLVAKNLLGVLLIMGGLVMFFTPGQGILTLLLGLALVDIPGKRAVERKIIQRPSVLKVVNRLRARAHQPPLRFE